jgi:hypothetical protein
MKNSISLKAIDESKKGKALNDTEVKAIFDFSEDISTGGVFRLEDDFEILITSKYKVCQSCQTYIAGMDDFLRVSNKNANFKIFRHPKVKDHNTFKLKGIEY